ncbi:CoA transferase [Sphingomonas aurantiaca]
MGPSVGLILADLGADVIKVEPKGVTRHGICSARARDISRCSTATSGASASISRAKSARRPPSRWSRARTY